jgi:hypothetical protein
LSVICCTKDEDSDTISFPRPESIQYLIDEPMSMLDWGLYKINKELDDYFSRINDGSANEVHVGINYNIAEGKIEIWLQSSADNFNAAKEICIINTNRIREKFGINAKTGAINPLHQMKEELGIPEGIIPDPQSSFLYLFFEHSGWNHLAEDESYKPMPVSVRYDLDAITTIKSNIIYTDVDSSPLILVCRAELVGRKILGWGGESFEAEVIYE